MPSLKSLFQRNSTTMTAEESKQMMSIMQGRDKPTKSSGPKSKSSSNSRKSEALKLSDIRDIHDFVLSLKDGKEGEELLKRFVETQTAVTVAPPKTISFSHSQ